VLFVPIIVPKQVKAVVRGTDNPKKVRKAIHLAMKMEVIKYNIINN
jgi:predicted RNA binding protein with dsRBD fold (UPF0201 family)